jgi:hypothetical protein
MQAAIDFLKGVGSRMCDEETLNALLQKIDRILAQQENPPPALLGDNQISGMTPTSVTVQDGPSAQNAHNINSSAHRPRLDNNRLSSTGENSYDIPEAELFTLNDIMSGTNDFGYDSLYPAMSILGSGWPPGMPDGMGPFMP